MFKLPCLFSKRTTDANVMNIGDVETEPAVIITMIGNANTGTLLIYKDKDTETEQKLELEFPVKIKKKTEDGKEEEVNYTPANGDVITLDIQNRRIYNQHNDNLVSCLSQTSFLSEFFLKKGKNHIKVENHMSNSCTVVCKYSNKYVEAVIA